MSLNSSFIFLPFELCRVWVEAKECVKDEADCEADDSRCSDVTQVVFVVFHSGHRYPEGNCYHHNLPDHAQTSGQFMS